MWAWPSCIFGPGTLARNEAVMLPGSPSSKVRWSWPNASATWLQSIGNIRRGGSEKAIVSRWWFSASRLPERRKKGTPSQRQLSTKARRATKVSVSESAATPSSSR